MKKIILTIILLFQLPLAYAASSGQIREANNLAVNFHVAPVNFPIPLAWGGNINFIASKEWMIGLDYQQAKYGLKVLSVDIGEIKEQSLTLQARRFYGNSFNLLWGWGKRRTIGRMPDDFFDLAIGNFNKTFSEMQANFVRFGIGNQWVLGKKANVAIDWFTINIPYSGKIVHSAAEFADSEENKEDVRDAEDILKFYPSLSTVHFTIGVVF